MLIVIAIIAILAAIIILAINPIEQMKKTRDARRMADLQSLNQALQYAELDLDPSSQMGSSSVVYVSLPSSNSDCSDLGLPALNSPWTYHCSSQDNYRKADGSGWVPVNFTSLKAVPNALTILPIDPLNTASSPGYYYTYVTGGSWKLTAVLESSSNANKAINDGGTNPSLYETGTNLSLASFCRTTVGYWKFDEGSGQIAFDSSGYQNNCTLHGPTWTTGKIGNALSFDGVDDYVNCGNNTSLNVPDDYTIEMWIYNKTATNLYPTLFNRGFQSKTNGFFWYYTSGSPNNTDIKYQWSDGSNYHMEIFTNALPKDTWTHAVFVFTNADKALKLYTNGSQFSTTRILTGALPVNSGTLYLGCYGSSSYFFSGLIDEVRIYNRALSADEILQHYQAGL